MLIEPGGKFSGWRNSRLKWRKEKFAERTLLSDRSFRAQSGSVYQR